MSRGIHAPDISALASLLLLIIAAALGYVLDLHNGKLDSIENTLAHIKVKVDYLTAPGQIVNASQPSSEEFYE